MGQRPTRRAAIDQDERFVSRAAYKLASVAEALGVSFNGKRVLDVGSSTGGFSDYSLQMGAQSVIAVEKGTNQFHPKLRVDSRIELHEKTDIRDFALAQPVDLIVVDLSFVSTTSLLRVLKSFCQPTTELVVMVKPQFEATNDQLERGIVKNERIRRDILRQFEEQARRLFVIYSKSDAKVSGLKGNVERFYLLRPL